MFEPESTFKLELATLNSLFLIERRIEHRTALFQWSKNEMEIEMKERGGIQVASGTGYCLDLRTYKDTGGLCTLSETREAPCRVSCRIDFS